MPTVPNLETPAVQAEALPGRANPRIDTDAPAGGTQLAQGLDAVANAGVGAEMKRQSEQEAESSRLKAQWDNLRVIDADTQLEAAKEAMLHGKRNADGTQTGGAYSFHGLDAMNMPARILPQYDQAALDISSKLSPDQQQLFYRSVANGKVELNKGLSQYEFQESNRLAGEIYKNGTLQTISSASVGWRDPDAIQKARANLAGLVTMQGDRDGWSPELREQEFATALAQMHFSVVDRMIADGKPGAALQYFKKIRDTSELTGEQAKSLGSQIDSAIQQHTAQNQTAVSSQLRDVSAAAMNGLAIAPASMPSKAAVLAAFPQDGERRWQSMQSDIALGATLKGMSGMSTKDIGDLVNSAKPTQVEGAADQLERYSTIARAAQSIVQQRAADPRQYVIDNKLGSEPLNFSDMGKLTKELTARAASTQADSQRLGGYVPILSKPEAQQFSQRLSSMKPSDQLKTLASLSTNMGDDRATQTVMKQIMPGNPVAAIVGSQVNQTKPNLTPVWTDPHFLPKPEDLQRTLYGNSLLHPVGDEKTGLKKPIEIPGDGTQLNPGMRSRFDTAVGDLFRNRPELGEAIYQSVRAQYAGLSAEAGDIKGDYVQTRMNTAIKNVLGYDANSPQQFNGKVVVAPPGMDPDRFESAVTQSVDVLAKSYGMDPKVLKGYQIEEIGGLGSGRYKLTQGNAELVKPDGSGLFVIDLRNQYLPDRAKPMPQDVKNQAVAPAAPEVADSVGGRAAPARETTPAKVVKAPPVTGLGKGRGGTGRTHPSQADPETD